MKLFKVMRVLSICEPIIAESAEEAQKTLTRLLHDSYDSITILEGAHIIKNSISELSKDEDIPDSWGECIPWGYEDSENPNRSVNEWIEIMENKKALKAEDDKQLSFIIE